MIRGGAPCVSESYMGYFERFITEQRLADVFLLNPGAENDYLGFGATKLAQHLSPAIVARRHPGRDGTGAAGGGCSGQPGATVREEWRRFAEATVSLDQFQAESAAIRRRLGALPRTAKSLACPRVVVTGDFFTRFSPFFMEGVVELYAEHGIILKPVDLSDLLLYGAYHGVAETAGGWGLKPGGLALARACTRIFQPDGKDYLRKWAGYQAERWQEQYYRGLFLETGLLVAGPNDVSSLFEKAAEHVSPSLFGETIPTIGKGLEADSEGYDGIIVIGPFNCLPYRISEAILKPLSLRSGTPILTYESDGYAVSPSFPPGRCSYPASSRPRRQQPCSGFPAPSKRQRELVAQDVVAIDPVDRRLALPTLAAQFALDCRLALRHSSGQRQAQIKIAPHTLIVRTGEAEQCLGVRKIEKVHLASLCGDRPKGPK